MFQIAQTAQALQDAIENDAGHCSRRNGLPLIDNLRGSGASKRMNGWPAGILPHLAYDGFYDSLQLCSARHLPERKPK